MPVTPRLHRAPRAAASPAHLLVVPARRSSLVAASEPRALQEAALVAAARRPRR